jgi:hypothetical protein
MRSATLYLLLDMLFCLHGSIEAVPVPMDRLPSINVSSSRERDNRVDNTPRLGPYPSNWSGWNEMNVPGSARGDRDQSDSFSNFEFDFGDDSESHSSFPTSSAQASPVCGGMAHRDGYSVHRGSQYGSSQQHSPGAFLSTSERTVYHGDPSGQVSVPLYDYGQYRYPSSRDPFPGTNHDPWAHGAGYMVQGAQRGETHRGRTQRGHTSRGGAHHPATRDRSQGTRGSGVFIPLHGGYATREQLEEKIETEVQRDPNEQIESRRESRQRHLLFIEGVREKLDNIEQQLLDPTLTVKKRTGLAQMRENAIGVLNEHAKREAESQHEIQEWFGNDPVLAQRPQGRGKSKEGKGAELQYLSESTAKMHLG